MYPIMPLQVFFFFFLQLCKRQILCGIKNKEIQIVLHFPSQNMCMGN